MPQIDGQLKSAQLEEVSGSTTTPASRSRIFSDISDTTNAKPRFYTGSAWVPIKTGQTAALYDNGNSGTAITINWSNGLNQKVTLSNNCLISFSNPVSGEDHKLYVIQGESTQYVYKLNMTDQYSARLPYQPVGVAPRVSIIEHVWNYAASTVPALSTLPTFVTQPATLPPSAVIDATWKPDGKSISLVHSTSTFSHEYAISDGRTAFYGARRALTTALPGPGVSCEWSPDGAYLAFASTSSTYIRVHADPYVSTAAVFSDPGTVPTGAGADVSWHPSGLDLAIAHTTSPFVSVYPFSSSGFGSKYSNPATLPTGNGQCASFSPMGEYLAVGHTTTPFISVYPWTVSSGFGTKIADASTLPTGAPVSPGAVAWRPQGDWIALGTDTSPFMWICPFVRGSSSFGTPPNTSTFSSFLPGTIGSLSFSPCGNYLVAGSSTTPFLVVMTFDSSTGVTGNITLTSNPGQVVQSVEFSPSGEYLLLGLNASPFVMIYPMVRGTKNYLRQKYI